MIHQGDALSVLRTMPAESVQCVVTSPPYWGLRDYGTAGQLGLEATPEIYVAQVVEVFREVRRVLRRDGTLWLNLGDSYAGGTGGDTRSGFNERYHGKRYASDKQGETAAQLPKRVSLKPKDLIGIPWRVAFALQADGWYLRSDIIWSKPNPMPESVTDRPTKAHEYLFLMSKSERYFYDAGAIREPVAAGTAERYEYAFKDRYEQAASGGYRGKFGGENGHQLPTAGRNKRTVWEIATQPCPEAHFATYPEALVEPCIKAGCPKGGTVLDPFLGSGTTAVVAKRLGREYIGIELNPAYIRLAEKRIGLTTHEPELFEETA